MLQIANELNQSFQGGEVNGEEADSVDPVSHSIFISLILIIIFLEFNSEDTIPKEIIAPHSPFQTNVSQNIHC